MRKNYLWLWLCTALLAMTFTTMAQNCTPVSSYTLNGSLLQLNASIPGISQPSGVFDWTISDAGTGVQHNLQGQNVSVNVNLNVPAYDVTLYYYDSTSRCSGIAYDTVWLNRGVGNCSHTGAGFHVVSMPGQTLLSAFTTGFGPNAQFTWSTGQTGMSIYPNLTNGWNYVCLTVTDGSCSLQWCDSIYSTSTTPCSNFWASTSHTLNGNTANFAATVNGSGNYSYSWDFAGLGTSALAAPSFTFPTQANGAIYGVTLTINDLSNRCTYTAYDSVIVPGRGPCNGHVVDLGFNFDNYANEISWDVRDLLGNVMLSSNGNYSSVNNGRSIVEQLCLPTGCYELNVYDSWGDGLCCAYGQGDYSLIDPATGGILASGARFGRIETTQFCVGGATNPCSYLSNVNFQYTLGPNGSVSLSSGFPLGTVSGYSWSISGSNGTQTSTALAPTFNVPNGYYTATLVVSDSGCQTSVSQSLTVSSNRGNNGNCANIIPGMTIYQDTANPYLVYVVPTLANVPPSYSFNFYWQFGNNSYSGLPVHNFTGPGSYTVCYVAFDSLSQCRVSFCDTISLDSSGNMSRFTPGKWQAQTLPPVITYLTQTETTANNSDWNLSAFPNPAQTQITLQWETSEALDANLTILDLTGKAVHHQQLNGHAGRDAVTLDIAQLPAGVYLLRLVNDTHQEMVRFIKQ